MQSGKKAEAHILLPAKITKGERNFLRIKELQQEGHTKREIVRQTGIAYDTINKYWEQTEYKFPQRKKYSGIEEYDTYLRTRFMMNTFRVRLFSLKK